MEHAIFVFVKLMNTIVFLFAGKTSYLAFFSWNIDGHCDTIVPFLAGQLTGPSSILGENHRCDGCDGLRVPVPACQKKYIDVNQGILQRVKDIYIYIL